MPETVEGLSDKEVLVLLQGWKYLSAIRGFKSVDHEVIASSYESVTVKTTIIWAGNYETSYKDVAFSALATASLNNTNSFAKNYLAEIAENRGLCRAIRGFLRIPIVGFDEVGPSIENGVSSSSEYDDITVSPTSPHFVLKRKLGEYGISWEVFKANCIKRNIDGAEEWTDLTKIPSGLIFNMIGKLEEGHKRKLTVKTEE